MAGVNGLGNIYIPQSQQEEPDAPKPFSQILPPRGPTLPSQQSVQSSAMAEAMESMSLVMGSRLRDHERRTDNKGRSGALSEKLTAWVANVSGPALVELMSQFSDLGSGAHNPLAILEQAGLEPGVMALLLAGLLQGKSMPSTRRRRLEQALATLLEDDTLSVDMFAWLELSGLDKQNLIPVRMLYERSRNGEDSPESLMAWYQEVCDWPDREKRLKILIQALALELNFEGDRTQLTRIAHSIQELKRLLLFFNLAEHSAWVATAAGMEHDKMLREILNLLSELWVYADGISERLDAWNIPISRQIACLRAMLEFIRTLPSLCFRDDEHQGQITEALEQVQDRLADQE